MKNQNAHQKETKETQKSENNPTIDKSNFQSRN